MRILIVSLNYAPEATGIGPYSAALADGLRRAGHQVRVLTGVPHYPQWTNFTHFRGLRRRETINGVPVVRSRHFIPPGGTGLRRGLMELTFALGVLSQRWGAPDVVVTTSPSLFASLAVMVRARSRRAVPVVCWVQDLYSRGLTEIGTRHSLSVRVIPKLESWLFRRAARVALIHERYLDVVATEFTVAPERLVEMRNWTREAYDSTPADVEAFRHRHGWDERSVILHAGSMGARQGLTAVVEAARMAHDDGLDLLFVMMGDGSECAALKELAGGLDNIQFLPPTSGADFNAALHAADVLLVVERTGVKEVGLPSKLTTYFAAGRPVVAAVDAEGACAQEVRRSGAGLVTAQGSGRALLDGVKSLLNDHDHGVELGQNGARYAAARLSYSAAMRRWESLLAELTGPGDGSELSAASGDSDCSLGHWAPSSSPRAPRLTAK